MAITDLTGTKWYFNANPDVSMMAVGPLALNFTSNNTNYVTIRYGKDGPLRFISYNTGSNPMLVYQDGTWTNEAYRTIEITGGTDATNTTLIDWLEANATLSAPEPTGTNNIWVGSTKLSSAFIGNNEVIKMYFGNTLIYEKASSGYSVEIYNNTNLGNVNIYDGQDNTGTLLGTILIDDTETYIVSSGYLYVEWDDQFITDDITFAEDGSDIGNPIQVNSNMSIEVWDVEPVVPYITFSSTNPFTLNVVDNVTYWDGTLEYSTNATTWNTWTAASTISSGVIGSENILYMRGTNNTQITSSSASSTKGHWVLIGTNIRCVGNIENLLDYATVLQGNHPTMAASCYKYMFYKCTSLTTAPQLPATTLIDYCYYSMFDGCTGLTTAPNLPATSLAVYCYKYMFSGCTGLTTAPNLPATSLASYCYQYMFQNCTSLTTAPALPATTLIDYCYQSMFSGCTGLTTVTINSGINSVRSHSFSGTFANCPSLLDGFIDLTNITTLSAADAFGGITNSFYPELRFGTQLISITSGNIFKHSTSLSGAMSIRYLFTDNDTPQFTLSNAISKGSSKASITYKIYTDNTAIKDAVLANADQYTTVSVYHLDNSEWGVNI